MSDASLWLCPRCQTANDPTDRRCVVCEADRSTTFAASPAEQPPDSAVLFVAHDAPPPARDAPARHCGACGGSVRADQRFCPRCGAATNALPAPVDAVAPVVLATHVPESARESSRTWLWITASAVLVILIAVVVLVATRPQDTVAGPLTTRTTVASGRGAPGTSAPGAPDGTSRSVLSAPPATVAAPPAATPGATSSATPPRAPVGTPPNALAALDAAQSLASAYAHHDWAAVRRVNPAKTGVSDSVLGNLDNYGDLEESTAVLVSGSPLPSTGERLWQLRLGLVADQINDRASIYCVTWTIDLDRSTVSEAATGTTSLANHVAGTLDPSAEADRIRREC